MLLGNEESLQLDKDREEERIKGPNPEPQEREAFVEAERTFFGQGATEAAEGVAVLSLAFFLQTSEGGQIRSSVGYG